MFMGISFPIPVSLQSVWVETLHEEEGRVVTLLRRTFRRTATKPLAAVLTLGQQRGITWELLRNADLGSHPPQPDTQDWDPGTCV